MMPVTAATLGKLQRIENAFHRVEACNNNVVAISVNEEKSRNFSNVLYDSNISVPTS